MSTNIDISIDLRELYRRVLENKARVTEYVRQLYEVYAKINESDLPNHTDRVVVDIPNSVPIIIYNGPSREAYRELLIKAIQFLKLEYAVYAVLEDRLGRLKDYGFKAMVRYFSDVPSLVVIDLDSAGK